MKQLIPPFPVRADLALLLAIDAYSAGGWRMLVAGLACGGALHAVLNGLRHHVS